MMDRSKKAILVLVPGLLLGLGAAVWAATPGRMVPTDPQAATLSTSGNSVFDILNPASFGIQPSPPQLSGECKRSQLYSQHDVVGDPEACFKGRLNLWGGSGSAAGIF